jgi:hypothetical protein
VINPVLDVVLISPEDNRIGSLLQVEARPGLNLKGDQLAGGSVAFDDFDVRVDPVVVGVLLPKKPPVASEEVLQRRDTQSFSLRSHRISIGCELPAFGDGKRLKSPACAAFRAGRWIDGLGGD